VVVNSYGSHLSLRRSPSLTRLGYLMQAIPIAYAVSLPGPGMARRACREP